MENRSDMRERLSALTLGMKILIPATALLFIDLFLRWQEVCVDLGPLGETCGGVSAWDNFWGIVLGLLTIAMLVWIGLQLANVDLSGINLPVTHGMITLGLGVGVLAFAVLKNLIDDYSTIWSYIGVVLAAAVAYGAFVRSRELEGLEATGLGGRGTGSGLGGPDTTSTTGTGYAGTDVTPPATTPPPPAAPPTTPPGGTTTPPPPPRDDI